jgi:carbamoylphosphate synthase large subunit
MRTEDRDLFKEELLSIDEKVAKSGAATSLEEALDVAGQVRPLKIKKIL